MPLTGAFDTSDGALVLVGAFKVNPLQDICNVLGIEDLSVEYPDLQAQTANKAYLQERFKTEFAKESTGSWIEKLEQGDLLCAPIRELAEVLEDPQTHINEMIAEIDHPINGKMQVIACPIHFSSLDTTVRRVPPKLGEHNDEILAELGITATAEAASQ